MIFEVASFTGCAVAGAWGSHWICSRDSVKTPATLRLSGSTQKQRFTKSDGSLASSVPSMPSSDRRVGRREDLDRMQASQTCCATSATTFSTPNRLPHRCLLPFAMIGTVTDTNSAGARRTVLREISRNENVLAGPIEKVVA